VFDAYSCTTRLDRPRPYIDETRNGRKVLTTRPTSTDRRGKLDARSSLDKLIAEKMHGGSVLESARPHKTSTYLVKRCVVYITRD
jgi:hypothetical protein